MLRRALALRPTYHWLRLRAVAHPTEDPSRVAAALRFVSGLDEDAFQAALAVSDLQTHHGLDLRVLSLSIDRSRTLRDVLARLLAIPGAIPHVAATLDARVDDDGILYLRLEKQAAYGHELRLGDGEDTIQVRLKVEAYPAGRPAALQALRGLLASGKA